MRDRLLQEFTENYMEKLFYFCLKKTGNKTEAEDLTQDIALQIITALNKGTIPTSFYAWVWQIARNRYAVWAAKKHHHRISVTGSDIGDYELEDDDDTVLDDMIHTEQLSLLRRELAFIKQEYRSIVIAHYIENNSIREIAAVLSLTETAVKQRLFRARKLLMEGMDMAREFGKRSYHPEEVNYITNCLSPGGENQPYSILRHKLYQNIILQAYDHPSDAEALALELGIALPYMEDELEYLTQQTLLIKKDNRYITAFPIVSEAAQQAVHAAQMAAAPELANTLHTLVDALHKAFGDIGYAYYGTYQEYDSAKWTLMMLAYDHFLYHHPEECGWSERPDGGNWDIIGYQHCDITEPCFVGNHVSDYGIQQFRFEHKGIDHRTPSFLTGEEAKFLYDSIIGNAVDSTSDIAHKLETYGYLHIENGICTPTILVLKKEEIKQHVSTLDDNTRAALLSLANGAKQLMEQLYQTVSGIINDDLPRMFSVDEHQRTAVIRSCYFSRGYIMEEALRQGYLTDDEHLHPAVGAYLCF